MNILVGDWPFFPVIAIAEQIQLKLYKNYILT